MGLHRVVETNTWTDNEPTDLEIAIELDNTTGKAFVVFVSHAAWLDEDQVVSVIDVLNKYVKKVHELNAS